MMFASMIEIVIMPRFGTGAKASLLTAGAPRTASSRQPAPLPARGFLSLSGLALGIAGLACGPFGAMKRPRVDHRTAPRFGQYLGGALAA
jgi:hypothetical protein